MTSDPEVKRLKRVFGVVYFVQGMKHLPDLSIFFYLMNVLKLGPVAGQLFQGLTHAAWFIKPLWGWISDRFPIFGYRRKPYFVLMALIALVSWVAVGLCAHFKLTAVIPYFILVNVANLAYAFVDVVADAVMVEQGQKLKKVGSFVNFQWLALGFSLMIVALASGWFQQKIEQGVFSYGFIFAATGFFPLLTAVVGITNLKEDRLSSSAHSSVKMMTIGRLEQLKQFCKNQKHIFILMLFIIVWHFTPSIGYVAKIYQVKQLNFTPMIFGVLGAVKSVVWIFSILFYRWFVKRFPSIRWDQYLYGMIVLGMISLVLGYYFYLPPEHPLSLTIPFPWNEILSWAQPFKENRLGEWFYSFLEQASSWNRYHWWALFTDAILLFAAMPAWLIPLTLAGEAASKAHAGFIYALLMSVSNFTNAIEDVVGGVLYKLFSISGMQWFLRAFENSIFNIAGSHDMMVLILQIFVYIGAFFTLIAIPFIYWIKREFDHREIQVHLT